MTQDWQEKNYRILIVDDVLQNIQVIEKILQKESYEMAFAQDGKTTLERVGKKKFDHILPDIVMPDMDGFEVCKKLKEDQKTSDIPVIFITVKDEMEDMLKGFEAGAVYYVTKPFNHAELLARVRTHAELKNKRDNEKELISRLQAALAECNRVEETLKKSEEKYRVILENASDAILLADEKGNLLEVNRNPGIRERRAVTDELHPASPTDDTGKKHRSTYKDYRVWSRFHARWFSTTKGRKGYSWVQPTYQLRPSQ